MCSSDLVRTLVGATIVVAAVAVAEIVATQDPVMLFHAWVLLLSAAGAGAWIMYANPAGFSREPAKGYNDAVVKAGVIASMFWGIAGFLAGDVIAWQLAYPVLNFDLPWINFGRLRPLHTSAVIFAFGGNVLIAATPVNFYLRRAIVHKREHQRR